MNGGGEMALSASSSADSPCGERNAFDPPIDSLEDSRSLSTGRKADEEPEFPRPASSYQLGRSFAFDCIAAFLWMFRGCRSAANLDGSAGYWYWGALAPLEDAAALELSAD